MSETKSETEKHAKTVEISIDGDIYTASSNELTADDVLRLAGIDPSENYLVEKHGREQTSYQGKGSTVIKIHEKETFISVPTGAVTVS